MKLNWKIVRVFPAIWFNKQRLLSGGFHHIPHRYVEMELSRQKEAAVSHLMLMQEVRGKKKDRGRMKEKERERERALNSFGFF